MCQEDLGQGHKGARVSAAGRGEGKNLPNSPVIGRALWGPRPAQAGSVREVAHYTPGRPIPQGTRVQCASGSRRPSSGANLGSPAFSQGVQENRSRWSRLEGPPIQMATSTNQAAGRNQQYRQEWLDRAHGVPAGQESQEPSWA